MMSAFIAGAVVSLVSFIAGAATSVAVVRFIGAEPAVSDEPFIVEEVEPVKAEPAESPVRSRGGVRYQDGTPNDVDELMRAVTM